MRIVSGVIDPKVIEQKIAQWMNANPPAGGQPPTDAQVRAVVDAYMAQFPAPKGDKGDDGDKGDKGNDGADGKDGEDGQSIKGDAGSDGRTPEFIKNGGFIKWRYVGDGPWNDLVALADLEPSQSEVQQRVNTYIAANPPADGKSVSLQASNGYIQFRQGDGAWQNLVSLDAITGPRGASALVNLPNVTLTQNAAIAISAGIRTVTVTGVTGVLAGDALLLLPITDLPAGYAIHNAWSTVNNQVKVTLTAPLLAIGASYSITMRLVALR